MSRTTIVSFLLFFAIIVNVSAISPHNRRVHVGASEHTTDMKGSQPLFTRTTIPRPPAPGTSTAPYFLSISDLHLDVDYQPTGDPSVDSCHTAIPSRPAKPLGQYGCDSPFALVDNVFATMQASHPDPSFILITGDYGVHGITDPNTILSAIKTIGTTLRRYYPSTPVVPTLGNNDVFPDYVIPCNASWYREILTVFQEFDFEVKPATFTTGGYSYVSVGGENIIALNTVLYSKKAETCNHQAPSPDPSGQLAWLNETLAGIASLGGSAIIAGHIPPGYRVVADGGDNDGSRLYNDDPDYASSYFDIIKENPSAVKAQIFGHLHFDTLRLYWGHKNNPPGPFGFHITTGAVSPIRGNNPSYRVVMQAGAGQAYLQDTQVFNLDLAVNASTFGMEYAASSKYGIANLSGMEYYKIWNSMASNDTVLDEYRLARLAGANDENTSGASFNRAFICSVRYVRKPYYSDCVEGTGL